MPDEPSLESEVARIQTERERLRAQLRAFEEKVHGELLLEPKPNWNRIRGVESRIRDVVLRLVELEREEIAARVAASL